MSADEVSRPHPALARNTGFLLSRLGMIAQRRFAERMTTLGLTPRMWGTLNVLDAEGAVTQHALCRSVGMDPSSMVSTIDELEAKGLVERRAHPTDRRAYALHITDPGREALTRGRKVAGEAQRELLAPLSEAERETLQGLLLRLSGVDAESAPPAEGRAGAGLG